ncbi:TRAP transporter substrate-binding protein [Breznakiella homolactica]|uniref:TRAP transporter substrate-binding protein n=1 Tax=Breznakiella homolactica TaxID=2798577 RepID=A0A7T7XNT0_9SPIR|nr:TRAP transporter substrate-binding protein [Breznakiella homolactica]QQO09643.1 TRAP transporter substrate-binding protein [Breznakiella homolactica]
MKKSVVIALIVSLAVLQGVFAKGSEDGAGKVHVVKLGTTNQANHPITTSLKHFGELLDQYSGGTIKVEVYSDGQLGNERDLVEGVQIGTLLMSFSSTGPVGAFAPKMEVINLPYLFRDNDHAYKVLDGAVGQEISEELLKNNIRNLAFWENGWRQMTNSKRVINGPADLRGLKIRVMESPIMVATINAMGGNAVPMGWSEVITSLQQGIIDGQENPIINNVYNGAYEVQAYLSLTRHFYNPSVLLINEKFYQGLSAEQKSAVERAAAEARDYQRKLSQEMEAEALKEIAAKFGLNINHNPDIAAFTKAVEPVYNQFADSLGGWELINKVRNVR